MTEQQITQNAEEYASHKLDWSRNRHSEDPYLAWKEGFEDGAHSRDEEIKKLKNAIDALKRENGQLKIDKEYWKESAMEYINRDNEKY